MQARKQGALRKQLRMPKWGRALLLNDWENQGSETTLSLHCSVTVGKSLNLSERTQLICETNCCFCSAHGFVVCKNKSGTEGLAPRMSPWKHGDQ